MQFDLNKIVRPNILKLKPYSSARDEFSGKEGIFLDANENPFGEINRYPDPYQKELKKTISQIKNISEENIFLGNGSDEVIDLIYRVFANPEKDKALSFSPTYGMYEVSADINDVSYVQLPLTDDFLLNPYAINSVLNDENLKIIFFCSPNNPSGNLLQQEIIEDVLNQFSGLVVIDEAYIDFSSQDSWIYQLEKYSNLMVLQTFSKAWGMAGVRVGMGFASKEIVSFLNKVKPPYNISQLNQDYVTQSLKDVSKFEKNLQIILDEKDSMIKFLSQLSFIDKIYPSDANFILIKVKDADKLYNDLIVNKIIIRNRNSVVNNCIRITIGSEIENKTLKDFLKNYQ